MGALTGAEKQTLINTLLALPFTGSASGRGLLLTYLPDALVRQIPETTDPQSHLTTIVNRTDAWAQEADGSWPIITLITTAADLMQGSRFEQTLRQLAQQVQTRLDHPAPPPAGNGGGAQAAAGNEVANAGGTTGNGAANTGGTTGNGAANTGGTTVATFDQVLGTAQIAQSDKDQLIAIVQNVPDIALGGQNGRIQFLRGAGWSLSLIGSYDWSGAPRTVATQLVSEAERLRTPLGNSRPGYTALGAVLSAMIADQTVGLEDASYIASVLVRYRLVDPKQIKPNDQLWPTLRPLLEIVPEPLRTPDAVAAFEATVAAAQGFLNRYLDANWLSRGVQASQAVCRIEVKVTEAVQPVEGTGFLLAPDLVLTNYHVVMAAIAGEQGQKDLDGFSSDHRNITLRFGYEIESGATTAGPGQVHMLVDSAAWCVDASPPDQFDYALLRLQDAAADDSLRGTPRGYIQQFGTVQVGDPLFILQHPQFAPGTDTAPLKLVMAYNAVTAFNDKRITYQVNTLPGASGSPCFTQEWLLTALHHRGSPDPLAPAGASGNEGIPIGTILAQPKVKQAIHDSQNSRG